MAHVGTFFEPMDSLFEPGVFISVDTGSEVDGARVVCQFCRTMGQKTVHALQVSMRVARLGPNARTLCGFDRHRHNAMDRA
jgi:hypothetical protein